MGFYKLILVIDGRCVSTECYRTLLTMSQHWFVQCLVLLGNKPLSEPMLTFYVAIWRHWVTMSKREQFLIIAFRAISYSKNRLESGFPQKMCICLKNEIVKYTNMSMLFLRHGPTQLCVYFTFWTHIIWWYSGLKTGPSQALSAILLTGYIVTTAKIYVAQLHSWVLITYNWRSIHFSEQNSHI